MLSKSFFKIFKSRCHRTIVKRSPPSDRGPDEPVFEMQVFNLEEAHIVYKINYINTQFSGVPMYKIGITFKTSPSLKRKIEDHSGITVDLLDYQKEFEEFIKNE